MQAVKRAESIPELSAVCSCCSTLPWHVLAGRRPPRALAVALHACLGSQMVQNSAHIHSQSTVCHVFPVAVMGRHKDERLQQAIRMALNSGGAMTFLDAYRACKKPGTWKNALRQWRAAQASAEQQPAAPAAPAALPMKTPNKRGAPVQQPTASSATSAPTQGRTGQLKNPIIRHSSAQAAKLQEAREAFWKEYKAAHKAATLELAESRRLCLQRKIGHRPVDIATKHDNSLSPRPRMEVCCPSMTWPLCLQMSVLHCVQHLTQQMQLEMTNEPSAVCTQGCMNGAS